jgi:hypothetical protein
MITGKDLLSLQVLRDIQEGLSVTAAAAKHALSLDQAKRLSRYRSILHVAEEHLSRPAMESIQTQGLKVLYIAELFKQGDWPGLEEILAACDEHTTRDNLKRLVQALAEKRERIQSFQDEATRSIASLEEQAKQLITKEDECQRLKEKIEESLSEFDRYGPEIKTFIVDHIGIVEEEFCLKKRLDSLWFQDLKKKEIIIYNKFKYLYIIPDLDKFIEVYLHRLKHRGNVVWDEDKEYKRWEKKTESAFATYYEFPNSPYYKNGKALVAENLTSELNKMEQQLQEIRKEQEKVRQKIKKKKKSSVMSFMESVEARNTLSAADLRTHGELQQKAMRWLYDQGYAVVPELVLNSGRRVDVIGFDKDNRIVIIEVKASRNDLFGDDKWTGYLDFCDELYFCMPPQVANWSYEKKELKGKADAGLLFPSKRGESLEIAILPSLNHSAKNREELIFHIARTLSKKITFGF